MKQLEYGRAVTVRGSTAPHSLVDDTGNVLDIAFRNETVTNIESGHGGLGIKSGLVHCL